MTFHSALISGSRSSSAFARSIVANRLHLAAGVMPFLNRKPVLRINVKQLLTVRGALISLMREYLDIQQRLFALFPMRTNVFQHVQTDCRREITLLACVIDLRDQRRHCRSLAMSDFLQVTPEGIFKADAGHHQ
jgi:hypothetical protein